MSKEFIPVEVGCLGASSTFFVELKCPNANNGCSSRKIIKHGHDTSVKGAPQHYECKECGRHFYPHTSAFFMQLKEAINEHLFSALKDGKIDTEVLKNILGSSSATVSRIIRFIVEKVAKHPKTEIFWKSPITARAIFIDETWINIFGRKWYLIVLLNEKGNVLAFELMKNRKAEKIIDLISRAERRLDCPIGMLITDDFSVYKAVATGLKRDLIHVRHIHKPPYGRMVIDKIEIGDKEIITTHIATTNDILVETNTFMVRISRSVKKLHEKGKRGRKKGSKNRPKAIIEREKQQRKSVKKRLKRGPKDPFKCGETHVYHYNKEMGLFHPVYNSDEKIIDCFDALLSVFGEKHVTTNPVENVFSVLKKLIDFRGKRDLDYWRLLIRYFFTVRECPQILKEVLDSFDFSPQILHKCALKLTIS